jgi:hypothetical protein
MFKSIYQGNGEQSCVKAMFGALLSRTLFPTHIPRLDLHQVVVVGPRRGCCACVLQLFMSVWVQEIVQVGTTKQCNPVILSSVVRLSFLVGDIICQT